MPSKPKKRKSRRKTKCSKNKRSRPPRRKKGTQRPKRITQRRKKLEKEQGLFHKDAGIRNFKDKQSATKSKVIDDLKAENYNLRNENENLKKHGTTAPGNFLEIPQPNISNSYRFVKNLNPSLTKYYTRFTRKYPAIEEALRKAHVKAKLTDFKAKLQQIDACFYGTQMTANKHEEILAAINAFLDECLLVDDLEVDKACEEFKENIMGELEKEIAEWRRKNPN